MTCSVNQKMAKHVNEIMAQSNRWDPILKRYVSQLTAGFWDMNYVNCAFQLCHSGVDVYAAYCFAHLHAWISIGKILTAAIEIGEGPREDAAGAENNAILGRLPYPFVAGFCGSNHGCDGYVKWVEPVEFGQMDCTGREITAMIGPRSIPLEVGYTKPDTTLYHILGEYALARWPYGSKRIHLLARNPNWPRCDDALD